jgi:hypothetical protein
MVWEAARHDLSAMRIFVSYHTPDAPFAKRIAEALEASGRGIAAFVAPRQIAAGGYWLPRLADELAQSDVMLFVAGPRIVL